MLGKVSIIVDAAMANFESDMGRAARIAEKEFRKIERDGRAMRQKMVENAKVIGEALGLAISAAATASVALARDLGRTADEIQRFATLANTSETTFQRWAFGARTVGIEQDKLADILKDMGDRVGDFIQTGGGPMADFFEKIAPQVGVTAEQFRKLSGPEALQLFVTSLEKAGLSANEMTFYMEAIASDSTLLLPLLQNNGKAMGELGDRAERVGAVMSGPLKTATDDYIRASREMDEVTQGLKNSIGLELLPRMTELITATNDYATAGDGANSIAQTLGRSFDFVAGVAQITVAAIRMVTIGIAELVNQTAAWYEIAANVSTLGLAPGTVKGGWNRSGQGVRNWWDAQGENWQMVGDGVDRAVNGSPAMRGAPPQVIMAGQGAEPAGFFKRSAEAVKLQAEMDKLRAVAAAEAASSEKAARSVTAATRERARAVEEVMTFEQEAALIQQVWDEAAIDRHNREVTAWAEKSKAVDRLADNNEKGFSRMQSAWEEAGYMSRGLMSDLIFRADEAGSAMERFGERVKRMAADLLADAAVQWLTEQLIAMVGNYYTPKQSNGYPELTADNNFGGGRAIGGKVSQGRIYEVAEGGRPELLESGGRTYLMPGSDGTVIPAGSASAPAAATGGGGNPVVNVYVSDSGSRTQQQGGGDSARKLGDMIGNKVREVLVAERRQGGLLWNMQQGR